MPSSFFAEVTGFQKGEAGNVVFFNESMKGKIVTLEGVWHYDFGHNRMRADYAESVDGTFMRDLTEYWEGNGLHGKDAQMAIYVFQIGKQCIKYDITAMFPGTNCIVRPDGFVRSNATHIERRLSQDKPGVWVDHFATGPPDSEFDLDIDIMSLLPVKDYGTGGPDATAANVFQTIVPGPQAPRQFDDLVKRTPSCITVTPALDEGSPTPGLDEGSPASLVAPGLDEGGSSPLDERQSRRLPGHAAYWLRRALM